MLEISRANLCEFSINGCKSHKKLIIPSLYQQHLWCGKVQAIQRINFCCYAKIKCRFQIAENITDSGNTNSTLLLVVVASNTRPIHLAAGPLREVFSSSFCFPCTQLLKWQKEASWTLWAFLWSIKLMPSHCLRKTVVQTQLLQRDWAIWRYKLD